MVVSSQEWRIRLALEVREVYSFKQTYDMALSIYIGDINNEVTMFWRKDRDNTRNNLSFLY